MWLICALTEINSTHQGTRGKPWTLAGDFKIRLQNMDFISYARDVMIWHAMLSFLVWWRWLRYRVVSCQYSTTLRLYVNAFARDVFFMKPRCFYWCVVIAFLHIPIQIIIILVFCKSTVSNAKCVTFGLVNTVKLIISCVDEHNLFTLHTTVIGLSDRF